VVPHADRDIISRPDKWEYPWCAAWDLAFHTLPLSIVDPDFAKEQMELMLRAVYLHPNGQMPAYVGCVVGVAVSWAMSKLWPLPNPKSQPKSS
jgi:hypothetical protein